MTSSFTCVIFCSFPRSLFEAHLVSSRQTDKNYQRALVWTAVMTALSHLDPDFGSVVAIEAINEPMMDATQTPGYGNCMYLLCPTCPSPHIILVQKNFVEVVRAVEIILGIFPDDSATPAGLLSLLLSDTLNATTSLLNAEPYGGSVGLALAEAAPMLANIVYENGNPEILWTPPSSSKAPLIAT